MNHKEVQGKSATLIIEVRKNIKNDQTNHISSQQNVLHEVFQISVYSFVCLFFCVHLRQNLKSFRIASNSVQSRMTLTSGSLAFPSQVLRLQMCFTQPALFIYKNKMSYKGLGRQLQVSEQLLLFQRTWVCVPVLTWQLPTNHNPSSRRSNAFFQRLWTPGMHMVHKHTCKVFIK